MTIIYNIILIKAAAAITAAYLFILYYVSVIQESLHASAIDRLQ